MKLLEGIVGVDRSRGTQTDPRSLGAPSPADRRKTTPSGPVSPGVARAGPGIRERLVWKETVPGGRHALFAHVCACVGRHCPDKCQGQFISGTTPPPPKKKKSRSVD